MASTEGKYAGGREKGMKCEDGVASVVALMLLLAVLVTFLSLYATTYLPALKEQAEIEQVAGVKEAFMRFDNDIEHVLSEKKAASYGETIRLGGGDILLSPGRSSGTVSAGTMERLFDLTASDSTGKSMQVLSNMTAVSYDPSFSFWEGQGYSWQYGYINVTKAKKSTPLSYNTMAEVSKNRIGGYAGRFLELAGTADKSDPSYLKELAVTAITFVNGSVTGERMEVSGNGACTLRINADVNVSTIQLDGTAPLTVKIPDSPFREALNSSIRSRLTELSKMYDNMECVPVSAGGECAPVYPGDNGDTYIMNADPGHPVTLILNNITISVYVQ